MRSRAAFAGSVVLASALCGCAGGESELALRFEAERARWRADRLEQRWRDRGDLDAARSERLAEIHEGIAREFGVSREPTPEELSRPDTSRRLQLAGASALFGADLRATEPSIEAAARYARVDSLYGFDPEIRRHARLREAWIRERCGQSAEALAIYAELLEGTATLEDPRLRALAVHAGSLANEVLSAPEASAFRARFRERLPQATAEPAARRVLAEVCFLDAAWEEGVGILAELLEVAERADRRAELALAMGEALEIGARDLSRAEARYREAMLGGVTVEAGTAARIRLARLLARSGRAREALGVANDLLGLDVLDSPAEVLRLRARCLRELGQTADARRALARAAASDPSSPHGLAAAADLVLEWRGRGGAEADSAALRLLTAAEGVPAPPLPPFSPANWSVRERGARLDSLWTHGVEILGELAEQAPGSVAERARREAARLARERLGEAGEGSES